MRKTNERVLVTGARGLVGAEVIGRLIAKGHSVVALVRSGTSIVRNDGAPIEVESYAGTYPQRGRVACVSGDVAKDRLGLDASVYDALQRSTDTVIHCAALTSFGRKPEIYEATNFGGTRRVIAFAQANGVRVIRLVHVSTAYVCGERPGVFSEQDLELGQRLGNPYETSKYRSECAVREAMRAGLPATILRPAIIVGDSKTGAIRKFDTLYTVIRLTAAGLVRTMPGDYGATLDIVPIDWVADSVLEAFEKFDQAQGRTLHLTSGVPVSLREINDVCVEFPSFHIARYVPRHVFDATEMSALERRYYEEVVSLYESYLTRQVRFARESTTEVLTRAVPATGKSLLRKIFRYAVAAGYMAPRPA